MDVSTRRRVPTEKASVPASSPSRNNKASSANGRSVQSYKSQPHSHQRKMDPSAPKYTPSPRPEGAKSSSSKFVRLDTSHGTVPDYQAQHSPDFDAYYDSDGSYGLSTSPGVSLDHIDSSNVHAELTTYASSSTGSPLKSSSNGGKKAAKSANHLLNFSYPARERPAASSYRRPQLSPAAPFRRERFVQANFRFIVSKDGEYTENVLDPDAVIDWELVEIVICPQNDEMTCSICLETPTCPRMAKCGHTFCYSCILQLFSYHTPEGTTSSIAPCPVCLREKIRLIDLRCVKIEQLHTFKTGHEIDFILLQRPRHLNLLYPVTLQHELDAKKPLPLYEHVQQAKFNRILVTDQLLDLFTTESIALDAAITSAKSSKDLTVFMEIAHEMLKEEIAEVEAKIVAKSLASSGSIPTSLTSSGLLSPLSKPLPRQSLSELMPEKLESGNCHYLYQAADGQQIFLHPLSLQYLVEEFGSESLCPSELAQMKILDLETKSVDEKTKKRFPALAHLPTSCQFYFALADVTPLLKQPFRKASFAEDVQKRQEAINKANDRETKKAAARAEKVAAARQASMAQNSPSPGLIASLLTMPDVVAPDLDESFPEISSLSTSTSVYPAHSPPKGSLGGSSTDSALHHSGYGSSASSTAASNQFAHRSHQHQASGSKQSSAWDKGTLISSFAKPTEEDFPALPTHKDKHGNMVLNEDTLGSSPTGAAPTSNSASSTSRIANIGSPMSWGSAAITSPAPSSQQTPTGRSNNKKKQQGKKTLLVI